jgi:hypothetical protein
MLGRSRGLTGPPDFVGVGAYLSGGAWWRMLLAQHPEITRAPRRRRWNTNFFQRFHDAPWLEQNHQNYIKIFDRKEGQKIGEWSDRYAFHPWTAPLLKKAAPEAKLIFMVRDPVERFRRQASRNLGGPRAGFPVYMAESIHRGRYASQLRQLETVFERERILILQLEACKLDPLGEWKRMLRFLEVDEDFVPHGLGQKEGQVEEVSFQRVKRLLGQRLPVPVELWPDLETTLIREYKHEVEEFAEMVPEFDIGLWPRFADGREPWREPGAELPRPTRIRKRPIVIGAGAAAAATTAGLFLADVI